MKKEKILITVKTYPTLSSAYDETVCTAGLLEDGTWIRIYPIPLRKLDEFQRYKKFDWVEVGVERNLKDHRPESHKKLSDIKIIGNIDTSTGWLKRNELVLDTGNVYTSFQKIIDDNKGKNHVSLATFKPNKVLDVTVEEEPDRNWDLGKLRALEEKSKQIDMFSGSTDCFKVVRKLPYKFRYVFTDESNKERRLLITDWELGALFWNSMRKHQCETKAITDVRNKYLKDLVLDRNVHFFVGTTLEWDKKNAPNPFTIIGVYSPPYIPQNSLF